MKTNILNLWVAVLIISAQMFVIPSMSQASSDSLGTEFYFAFQQNILLQGDPILFVSGKADTSGTVEIPGLNYYASFSVQANEVTTIDLPNTAERLGENSIKKYGVHVKTLDEVSIYGLNLRKASTDAFLALPTDILGLEYIAMSYNGLNSYSSQAAVVGVYDNTTVTFHPSTSIKGRSSSSPFEIHIDKGETYLIKAGYRLDLTGTTISASAPIAVMSGVECTNVPVGVYACDHIIEMMPPVATWGRSFLTVPLATRLRGDVFRFLAAQDDTKLYINGTLRATLDRGNHFETVLTSRAQVEANSPILVAQYSTGQSFDGVVSDPFMMLIPPTEQFLNQYTFSTPSTGYSKHFVNVVVPTEQLSSLVLDGIPVDTGLFSPVGSGGFSGGQIPITLGSHTIFGGAPFGIYVYGFGDHDSYGYPGGMAFEFINPVGDSFSPNVKLNQTSDVVWGMATDSEDVNADGVLTSDEDINSNGELDRRSEDINNDGILDPAEDINANGTLDRDTGIFKVELEPGATNIQLNVMPFIPGALTVNFSVVLIDPALPGSGMLRVVDGVGNEKLSPITWSLVPTLMDVRVIDTISTAGIEIDSSSFTKQPYSVNSTDESTVIEWRYDGFPANLTEDIAFDVILKNPVPGEERVVSHQVELNYNDLNGNPVRTELGQLNANVFLSVFDGVIATDKPEYGPYENAVITAGLSNLSQYLRTVDVQVLVEDAAGSVKSQESFEAVDFSAGEHEVFTSNFGTDANFAGDYRAHLKIFEGGVQVNEAFAPFTISPVKGITAKITSDKAVYGVGEPVNISSAVQSASPNYILQNIAARITLVDLQGNKVFGEDSQINVLLPQQTSEIKSIWNTAASPKGRYTLLIEASSTEGLFATASAEFDILGTEATGSGIKGTITAQPTSVQQGAEERIDYSITNEGNEAITDLPVSIIIADAATLEVKQDFPSVVTLPVSAVLENTLTVSTEELAPGQYLTLLQIDPSDTSPKTLARASFEVTVDLRPNLEITKKVSERGNLLVWLNYPWTSGQNCPDRVPIERALRESGMSYWIVTDKDDFQKELRNPVYTDFVILGDHQPMEDHFSEELREQVHSGKGLVASMFNRRNLNEEIFGVNLSGSLAGESFALELLPSQVSAGAEMVALGKVLKAEVLDPEENVAWIIEEKRNQTERHPGAILRQYGSGKVVFLAFDLGLMSSSYDPFALLLDACLNHVHTLAGELLPGQSVPIELTMKNLAGSVDLKLVESFPPEVSLFSREAGLELSNPWMKDLLLALNETKSIYYTAVLPKEKGTFTLTSDIGYADNGSWIPYETYPLDLVVERDTYDLLEEISLGIDMLNPTLDRDRKRIVAAKTILAEIPNYEDGNRSAVEIQQIIHELLKALSDIIAVESVEVSELRENIDRLLSIFEARWYELQ